VIGTGVVDVRGTDPIDKGVRLGLLFLSSAGIAADMDSELRRRARFGSMVVIIVFDMSSSA
jgi:hypothetical protein